LRFVGLARVSASRIREPSASVRDKTKQQNRNKVNSAISNKEERNSKDEGNICII